jgi:AraC-like DNA-binding protein
MHDTIIFHIFYFNFRRDVCNMPANYGKEFPEAAAGTGANAVPASSPMKLIELEWTVQRYTYWENKREFVLETDVYPFWCLFAVESGSFSYGIGESKGTAGSGSFVLCPPSTPFRRSMSTPVLTFHFVLLSWKEPYPAFASAENNDNGGARLPVLIAPGNRQRLFDTFDKWRRIDSLSVPGRLPLLGHYWNDIWKTWCLEHSDAQHPRDGTRNEDELMNRAARRLEEQCAEPFGVKELAHELGLSSVQLIRRFRAAYRMTPGDYLTGLRMERACRLLRETRMTVEQIAASCGYATGYYLSRLFTSRIGVAPSEYRRRHRV